MEKLEQHDYTKIISISILLLKQIIIIQNNTS
jgi:hypothetical protein